MRTVKYISLTLLFLFPCITSSKEVVLPGEMGIEVILETSYVRERELAPSRTRIMKQGNRIRIEETIEVKGYQKLAHVSIYDGQSTWIISPEGKEKSEGFRGYFWTYPLVEGTRTERGRLRGKRVRIVDVERGRLYLDPEKDVILVEEWGNYKTYYKDYYLVKGVGYIPRLIEEVDSRGNLITRTELKTVERIKTFSDGIFDPDKVEIYIPPERRDVPD